MAHKSTEFIYKEVCWIVYYWWLENSVTTTCLDDCRIRFDVWVNFSMQKDKDLRNKTYLQHKVYQKHPQGMFGTLLTPYGKACHLNDHRCTIFVPTEKQRESVTIKLIMIHYRHLS